MTAQWIEVFGESRAFTVDRKNISKDFHFVLYEGEFGDFSHGMSAQDFNGIEYWLDDIPVQEAVMERVRGFIPLFFEFAIGNGQSVILYISTVKATQLNWGAWEIHMTFDIPDDNGKDSGGGDPSQNSDGDNLSEEYTQISCNGEATEKKIQQARVMECEMSNKIFNDWDALPDAGKPPKPWVISEVGSNAFIGQTKNSIEGETIFGRTFSMNITQYMSPRKLTYAYVRRLTRLIATVNNKDFFGFAPGSILFKGYTFAGHIYQNIPVTLNFDHKANFRFSKTLPTTLTPTIDQRDNTGRLITESQFDIINEPEFEDSIIGYNGGVDRSRPLVTAPFRAFSQNIALRNTNYFEPEADFGANFIKWPYNGINNINGVHSGWSIIDYKYVDSINAAIASPIKAPAYRTILMPYDYSDFSEFQL